MAYKLAHKNIIILLKSFALGGAEKQALFLANYLQNHRECNVFIYAYISSANSELFFEECTKYKLKHTYQVANPLSASGRFKYWKRRIKIYKLGLQFKKHKPDIIIPYLNPPSIISSLLYKIAGASKVFWHHRGVDYYRGDVLERKAVEKCPVFIANSEEGKEELENQFDLQSKKVYYLPNFSTLKTKKTIYKKQDFSIPEEAVVIGMIAHFRKEKLQHILVEAFSKVYARHPNIHVIFVGNIYESEEEQSNYSKVKALIEDKGLQEHITILHNTKGKDILPLLDIGVLLSEKEGMPNVIMEYMFHELPVISTRHQGCVDLLGEDYAFFTQNKTSEVTKVLQHLLENSDKTIGKKNRERLEEHFTIDLYINKLENILS